MAAKRRKKLELQISICGIKYDVRFEKLKKQEDDRVFPNIPTGRASSRQTLIQVEEDQSSERKWEVMIHECLHLLLYESATQDFIKQGEEENFVASLSAAVASFIRDNKQLLSDVGGF